MRCLDTGLIGLGSVLYKTNWSSINIGGYSDGEIRDLDCAREFRGMVG